MGRTCSGARTHTRYSAAWTSPSNWWRDSIPRVRYSAAEHTSVLRAKRDRPVTSA